LVEAIKETCGQEFTHVLSQKGSCSLHPGDNWHQGGDFQTLCAHAIFCRWMGQNNPNRIPCRRRKATGKKGSSSLQQGNGKASIGDTQENLEESSSPKASSLDKQQEVVTEQPPLNTAAEATVATADATAPPLPPPPPA
ncbi:unnamed protein product, partial [Heterosigma akashiwo]